MTSSDESHESRAPGRQSASRIEAIVFDFGNVIATFDNDLILERFSKNSGHSVEELRTRLYGKSGLPQLYEQGKLSSFAFYEKVSNVCDLRMSKQDFSVAYAQKFTPIPETLELILKLRNNGYKTGLLSNTSEWDYKIGIAPIIKGFFGGPFDVETLSFEVGAMKPDPRIFQDMTAKLGKIGCAPGACVFIDDIANYADPARKQGMNAITYTAPERLEQELRALGVDF